MSEKPSTPDANKPEEKNERKEATAKGRADKAAKGAPKAMSKGRQQEGAAKPEEKKEAKPPEEGKKPGEEKPKEAVKEKPAKEKPARRGAKGAGVGFIALVVAAGAAAGAGYLWMELQKMSREATAANASLMSRTEELQQTQATLRNTAEKQGTAIDALQTSSAQLTSTQQAIEEGLNGIREQLGRDRSEWAINEVEYLLRIGNRRLQLARDVGSAIAALEAADRRLLNQGDPAYVPVREHIAVELQSLRNIERLDVEGTAARLTGLVATIGELPLLGESVRRNAAQPESSQGGTEEWSWRNLGKDFGQWVKSLVVIRHGRKDVKPLLAAEEAFFLRQNLQLKLETARLALLERNTTTYQAALNEAAAWLREYFDNDAPAVNSALESIESLASLNISPPLPDISDSLRVLRDIRSNLRGRPETGEEGAP